MSNTSAYIISGGKKLSGEVNISGSKNIALKVIIASMLFDGDVIIKNVPRIDDVENLLDLLQFLGVSVQYLEKNTLKINSMGLKEYKIDLIRGSKTRVSFMLIAPLLHRFKKAVLPNPGGCRIGARPIDRALSGISALGAKYNYDSDNGMNYLSIDSLTDATFEFDKISVTSTEMLIIFACFGPQRKSIIKNVALEHEVDHLIAFLCDAGAKITRQGKDLIIESVEMLRQSTPYIIGLDRIEYVTFVCAALVTNSSITLCNLVDLNLLDNINPFLQSIGVKLKNIDQNKILLEANHTLTPFDIVTGPYPESSTDTMPLYCALATCINGRSTIHERLFEGRFSFVKELQHLGANINFIDNPTIKDPSSWYQFNYDSTKDYQQSIEIIGGTPLHNGVMNATDLRAGASELICALVAEGESAIFNSQNIDRGYENIVEKFQNLGASIQKSRI